MTLKELSGVYFLNAEIAGLEREIKEVEDMMYKISSNMSGMPRGGASDKTSTCIAKLVDYQSELETVKTRRIEEKRKIMSYINSISDPQLRVIFNARFIECLTWNEVAMVLGGNNTEYGVKKMCYRHLKKSQMSPEGTVL